MAHLIQSGNSAMNTNSAIQSDIDAQRLPGLWFTWAIAAIMLLVMKMPLIAEFKAHDPDDYTRLLQVRDWLAGQSWYDTRQYRWNPPVGGDIHWVRLGDLPLAALLYPLQLVLPQRTAEIAAMTILPLLQLLAAMALMRHLLRQLGIAQAGQFGGLVMLAIFPMLVTNFAPLRIDYHGWLGLCALAMTCLVVAGGRTRLFAGGLVAAVSLTLSLETMPFVLGVGGLLVLRYWWNNREDHLSYFAGLALGAPALTLAFRPPSQFLTPFCDVLSAPHLAAFAATGALFGILRLVPGLNSPARRLVATLPVPVIAGWLIFAPLGICAVIPLANVDPLVRATFFDVFVEASGLSAQQLSTQILLVWTVLLALVGGCFVLKRIDDPVLRERWAINMVFALLAGGISLVLMRAGITAQILTIPFCVALIMHFLPRARALDRAAPRIVATLVCLGLTTPILPTALAAPFDKPLHFERAAAPYLISTEDCDYSDLNALPPSRLFTPIAATSAIMAVTPHMTVAGTYHRDDRQIRDVILAFGGPIEGSRALLQRYRADYVAFCESDIEVPYLASQRADSLARILTVGRAPDWLEPVSEFKSGPLRVYRVR